MIAVHTTGVGSLPIEGVDEALEHVFSRYSLPFLPEPPAEPSRGGIPSMVRRILPTELGKAVDQGDGNRVLQAFERAAGSAAKADEVLSRWPALPKFFERGRKSSRLKLQHAGPHLIQASLIRMFPGCPAEPLAELTWEWIQTLSRALIARATQETDATFQYVFDEPLLKGATTADLGARYQNVFQSLPSSRVQGGLHCCNAVTLNSLELLAKGRILSIDLWSSDFFEESGQKTAALHVNRGGHFILGVFDTRSSRITPEEGMLKARDAIQILEQSANFKEVTLSGGCGTGTHPLLYERVLADGLKTVQTLIGLT